MGTCAGVPIEPPEQTALLDATLAIPGVLLAGVPGAGGYDAICVVVLHESVLHSVEEVWVQWPFQQSSLSERGSTQPTKFNDFSMPISSRQQTCKRKIREADAGVEEEREAATQEQNSRAERVEQKPYSIPGLRFATESWAGRKRSNEDRHMWSQDFYPGPVFGLFDGHGGAFTADFLTRHLVKTVASMLRHHVGEKALHALQESQELSREEALRKEALFDQATILRQQLATLEDMSLASGPDRASNELRDQLTAALVEIDDETQRIATEEAARRQCRSEWSSRQHRCFLRACHDAFERIDGQLLHKNPSQDGSTALLVWFVADALDRDVSLYTVNLGDSRAVLCRGGNGVALTKDHKPDVPAERQRIERAGGYVSNVGGVFRVHTAAGAGFAVQHECSTYLAVSRAFGDRSLKVPTPLVSWTPDVARFDVQADDLFVIVACDGIWDVLSAQEAVDLVLGHVDDAKAAADALVKAAYKKGSEDNLTATVIVFGWQADVLVPHVRAKMSSKMERDEEEIDMFNL
ncbi:hypothetical protein PsorP6_004354 [Peronosclerospora sorghi]|uniref:Uncharacterized protein n=1 Tax=Peronosclerospora sorghi TaxID=230839 RepID=A0ACC0VNX5_9STRA|nr:hypothetical protein PsorP6_004354 [Peronosclerospora sorghi]